MKHRVIGVLVGLLLLLGGLAWYFHNAGVPRRQAIQTLTALTDSLQAGDSVRLLQTVTLPAALQDRTSAEQFEFLAKALRDEVTPEGLELLSREAEFGQLNELFPQDGVRWAEQAGVRPEDCVAFKLDRNGLRTEVVLAKDSSPRAPPNSFKIIRCNNVVAPDVVQLSTKDQP